MKMDLAGRFSMTTKKLASGHSGSGQIMSTREARKFASDMKNLTDKASNSAASSRKLLASAGITTPKGNLKKPYK